MNNLNTFNLLNLISDHKEWLEWEPETIWKTIDEMFPDLPDGQPSFPRWFKDAIMAIKLCYTNILPWTQWNVFDKVAIAFNERVPMFHILQMPSMGEMALAVELMNRIQINEFSPEVQLYIANVAKYNGMILLPDVLHFSQDELDMINPKQAMNKENIRLTWQAMKLKGSASHETQAAPPKGVDDNVGVVQSIKLLAIDKYVKSKLS